MNKFITFKFKLEESETGKENTKSINIANIVCVSKVPTQRIVDKTLRNVEAVSILTNNGSFLVHADDATLEGIFVLFTKNDFDELCKSPIECYYFG